jgi:hypothetical protein
MKKTYIKPATILTSIIAQPMLFGGSNASGLDGGGNKGDLENTDEVLSRQTNPSFSAWDEEEEEQY